MGVGMMAIVARDDSRPALALPPWTPHRDAWVVGEIIDWHRPGPTPRWLAHPGLVTEK